MSAECINSFKTFENFSVFESKACKRISSFQSDIDVCRDLRNNTWNIYAVLFIEWNNRKELWKTKKFLSNKRIIAIIPLLQYILCLVLFRFKQFCKHSCVTHKHQNYIVLKASYICTYCFAILLHNIHTKIKSIKYKQNLVERRISLTNAAKRAYTNKALTDQTTNVNKFVGRSLIWFFR